MKPDRRPVLDPLATPETAVWMLYAGLVQGLRWRRHLATAVRPAVPDVARRARDLGTR
ncbi:MAG: hypothetical protein JSR54_03625 [Proteobacteria bacterium]|nr:hypothetical protein [Pseudomonadota bacterium]